jgi:hypothetical protein
MEATMTDKQTGGPAFPLHAEIRPTLDKEWCGMTLRDYFAAKSLEGLISATTKMTCTDGKFIVDVMDETHMTKIAYSHADAMLKARDGNP